MEAVLPTGQHMFILVLKQLRSLFQSYLSWQHLLGQVIFCFVLPQHQFTTVSKCPQGSVLQRLILNAQNLGPNVIAKALLRGEGIEMDKTATVGIERASCAFCFRVWGNMHCF